jgi:hypothetical protein
MQTTVSSLIPQFPNFKCLELQDRQAIECITAAFRPYSDFNFTSLYVWNVHNKMKVSQLNGNLVIVFTDYISNTPFLSFIGSSLVAETTDTLLNYADQHFGTASLRLVPETVAYTLPMSQFQIRPDRDAFDYIFSVPYLQSLHTLAGTQNVAGHVRKFIRANPAYTYKHCPLYMADHEELKAIYQTWANKRGIPYEHSNEYIAFTRLLNTPDMPMQAIVIYPTAAAPAGFMLFETLSNMFAVGHFCKADISFRGLYETLAWIGGRILAESGVQYLNFEQDLGIENLRKSKEKYMLHCFLKKFTVEKQFFSG